MNESTVNCNSRDQIASVVEQIHSMLIQQNFENSAYTVTITPSKGHTSRTSQQNKALHLHMRNIAGTLNEAGYDFVEHVESLREKGIQIPWNEEMVKKLIWKVIQTVVTGTESTKELSTKEVNDINETMTRHLATAYGVTVPAFPSYWNES